MNDCPASSCPSSLKTLCVVSVFQLAFTVGSVVAPPVFVITGSLSIETNAFPNWVARSLMRSSPLSVNVPVFVTVAEKATSMPVPLRLADV